MTVPCVKKSAGDVPCDISLIFLSENRNKETAGRGKQFYDKNL